MTRVSFDEIRKKSILKFSDDISPINERVAILRFSDLRPFISEGVILRKAIYCFLLVEGGSALIEINQVSKKLKRGDLVCAIPGDSWIWKKIDNLQGTYIFFESQILLSVLNGNFSLEPIAFMNSDSHYPYISLSEKRFNKLRELALDMEECLSEVPVFYDLIRCQLWQFIFLAEKEYIANGNDGRKKQSVNHIPIFINLVNRHFKKAHDVAFYAEEMNITSNYLNKIVKNSLAMSARQYILTRIMSEAQLLLRLTEISISELAYALGFNDPNYFIRYFKKTVGTTPKEFRKRGTL